MKKLIVVVALLLAGCGYIAVAVAPSKKAVPSATAKAEEAQRQFFSALHSGAYDDIPRVLSTLQSAYLDNPNDPGLASHIGFAHLWQLAERYRSAKVSPVVTDNIVLCRRYFSEAYHLEPAPLTLGLLASCTAAEGDLFKDEKIRRKGYFLLKDSVSAWPELNYFTMAYVMSGFSYTDPLYAEAVGLMWKNLDACAGETVNRAEPQYDRYLTKRTATGPKRACWNSAIAPHNDEGFFLSMGDMLVKAGDWKTARVLYANAKSFDTYRDWQFKDVLEERIRNAERNVAEFRKELPKDGAAPDYPTIMFQSSFACMACHQV
jgi:hypothetical protein